MWKNTLTRDLYLP